MAHRQRDAIDESKPDVSVVENLSLSLQELGGLPRCESRVLAALLLGAGPANSTQLAARSGIPRTSTYRVLEALIDQGLAERAPTVHPAAWSCAGWEAVVEVLDAAGQERLRRRRAGINRMRQALTEVPSNRMAARSFDATIETRRRPAEAAPIASAPSQTPMTSG